jgi:hypothetical protein
MGRSRRSAVLVAAVVVLAGIAARAAAGGVVTAATTISGPSPFAACAATDSVPGNVLNSEVEPWLAVNPRDSQVAVAWQQDRWGVPTEGGAHGLVAWSSATDGLSWAPFTSCSGGTAATNGNYDRASDVWLSYGPDGVLYQVSLAFDWFDAHDAVQVSRSTDDGATWSTPVLVDRSNRTSFNKGDDKESITADPYHPGVVYVVWDRYSAQNPTFSDGHAQRSNKGPAFFSKSTDGGRTWSDPAVIYNQNQGTLGNQIVVLPNGTLADFFVEYIATNVKGGVSWSQRLSEIQSSNGGATWTRPVVVSQMTPNGAFDPADGQYIRGGDSLFDVAVDSSTGALYAVWQDAMFSGVDQVAMSTSLDGGLTWSAPVRVDDTPARSNPLYSQAFTPSVDVAADGHVAITYYDFRLSPDGGDLADYWGETSSDGGATWSDATRLSTSSFPASAAPDAGGYMIGDYEALSHVGSTFVAGFEVTTTDPSNPTDIDLASFN